MWSLKGTRKGTSPQLSGEERLLTAESSFVWAAGPPGHLPHDLPELQPRPDKTPQQLPSTLSIKLTHLGSIREALSSLFASTLPSSIHHPHPQSPASAILQLPQTFSSALASDTPACLSDLHSVAAPSGDLTGCTLHPTACV